ncbi:unnamed protein product [Candida verbasci]|uniref:Topoisomerase I damage affected protein 2 n=1 Tax=Candida verbasci TaxID=1227364 RepID=A0A9W4TQK6_9ASCO|nr:unnamed protein product [Candida verbasci]
MSVIISSKYENQPPFTTEFIESLINDNKQLEPKELVTLIGEKLELKSSKHKFIIQYTLIEKDDDINLSINSDFVSIWDDSKDGCITLQINLLIITIYWLSI